MLRVLENGYRVNMVLTEYNTQSVDTIEDLRIVEKLLNLIAKEKRIGKLNYWEDWWLMVN